MPQRDSSASATHLQKKTARYRVTIHYLLMLLKYGRTTRDPRVNPTAEELDASRHCPWCHPTPLTNNWEECACLTDCGNHECGRVGNGEPDYPGNDMERPYEDLQCEVDAHDQLRQKREAAAFQEEISEIIEEQKVYAKAGS